MQSVFLSVQIYISLHFLPIPLESQVFLFLCFGFLCFWFLYLWFLAFIFLFYVLNSMSFFMMSDINNILDNILQFSSHFIQMICYNIRTVSSKKVLPCQPKFLEYAMLVSNCLSFFYQNESLKYLDKCVRETARKSSSNPTKSKSSFQSKICSKFQRCIQNPVENFSFCLLKCKKRLRKCSARSSIPTPTKLTIKTPEQHHSHRSCAFTVDFEQILYIGFHAYWTYFTNVCFHCFEQVNTIQKGSQKLKKIAELMHFSNVQLENVLV